MTDQPQQKMESLRTLLREASDIASAAAVLGWDQMTYMPDEGAEGRGRQIATLEKIAHEKSTSPEIGRLLDDLQAWGESQPYDSDDAALLRVTRREYDRATRLPSSFMAELAEHMASGYDIWTRARENNDFAAVQESLEKTLELSRRYADHFPGYEHPADPLIDEADYGMKASIITPLFSELQKRLTPLVEAITSQPPADDSVLRRHYPKEAQLALSEAIARDFGFDFARGRQDLTHHPFCTRFNTGDVRITTRIDENRLDWGFMSTLHEAGHAMYEQGVAAHLDATPLESGTSAGVHESQSRTWENIVGRSRGFWSHYLPQFKQAFPGVADDADVETFYRAINKVGRTLIRTEADEVTYNLHVIIRFGLELELLDGRLAVRDLPDAWRARYQEYLGVTPADDKVGVLQDVHWYGGVVGGVFQGYTLGNILSAQFYNAALAAHPEIPSEIAQGKFATLHGWLAENIYQHGSKFTTAELVQRTTGGELSIEPYMEYLTTKYGELYQL